MIESQNDNNSRQIYSRIQNKLNMRLEQELLRITRRIDNMEAKINVAYFLDQQMN